ILTGMFPDETVLDTLYLVLLCLAALHLGALLSVSSKRPVPAEAHDASPAKARVPTAADVRATGWLLLLVSVAPAMMLMREAIERVLSGGYFALYQAEQAVGAQGIPNILAWFLVPGAIFLLAGSKGSSVHIAVSAVIVLVNASCQLFLGFRYYAI